MKSQNLIAAGLMLTMSGLVAADDKPLPGITGTLKYHNKFESEFVDARNVNVWLPPSYDKNPEARYPVLYMHDGQNLHDPKTSFIGIDWGVDEAMTKLISEAKVREAIVVGIWNTPKRMQEYLPAKMVLSKTPEEREKLLGDLSRRTRLDEKSLVSDQYLKFIVKELKPFIDKTYRTKPDRADTCMMGSSAGALISLYAISEYPDIIGGVGCVSTHWPFANGLMIDYIKDKLPDPKTHKIYFDFGTETLDKGYEPYQLKMDEAMKAKGYEQGSNWLTKKFQGAYHSELSWRKRVDVPLVFLLGK